jgi:hypothetical protein
MLTLAGELQSLQQQLRDAIDKAGRLKQGRCSIYLLY